MLKPEELKDKSLKYLASLRQDMETLQDEREKYLDYYYQKDTIYENPTGRSKVISSDVHDVIEALVPSLMDIFGAGQT